MHLVYGMFVWQGLYDHDLPHLHNSLYFNKNFTFQMFNMNFIMISKHARHYSVCNLFCFVFIFLLMQMQILLEHLLIHLKTGIVYV